MNQSMLAALATEEKQVFVLVGHHDRLIYGERWMHPSFADHLNSLMMFKNIGLEWLPEACSPKSYNWVPMESQLGGMKLVEFDSLGDHQLNKSDRLAEE